MSEAPSQQGAAGAVDPPAAASRARVERIARAARGAFESAPVGIVQLALDGTVLWANHRLCAILGYRPETLIGRSFKEITHPDDISANVAFLQRLLDQVIPSFSMEKRYFRGGGEVLWTRLTASLVSDPRDGSPNHFVAVIEDISAHKQAERELSRSNALLAMLSRILAQHVAGASLADTFAQMLTTLIEATESEYGIIGEVLRAEDGMPYLKTHAITNIAWDQWSRESFAKNAQTGLEFRDLSTLFGAVMTSAAPVISNSTHGDTRRGELPPGHPPLDTFMGLPFHRGNELLGMVGVANRKAGYDQELIAYLQPFINTCSALILGMRAEHERQEAEQALAALNASLEQQVEQRTERLRESEHRLNLALAAGEAGAYNRNVQTGECAWTDSVYRLLGYTPGEVAATHQAWMQRVHPDDLARVEQKFRDCIAERSPDFKAEYRVIWPDGSLRWLHGRGKFEFAASGAVRTYGVLTDVTAKKDVEAALDREIAHREAVVREVHHRLKNNLHGVIGLITYHETKADGAASAVLNAAAARLRQIASVFGLRAIAESGAVGLVSLLKAVTAAAGPGKGGGARIEGAADSGRWQLADGHTVAVALLLGELVTNSIKHASGTEPPIIEVTELSDSLVVVIRNRGMLPAGFDVSKRSKTGIGLELAAAMTPRGCGMQFIHAQRGAEVVVTVSLSPPAIESVL